MELLALIGLIFLCYFLSKGFNKFSLWCKGKSEFFMDFGLMISDSIKDRKFKVPRNRILPGVSDEEFEPHKEDVYTKKIREEIEALTNPKEK